MTALVVAGALLSAGAASAAPVAAGAVGITHFLQPQDDGEVEDYGAAAGLREHWVKITMATEDASPCFQASCVLRIQLRDLYTHATVAPFDLDGDGTMERLLKNDICTDGACQYALVISFNGAWRDMLPVVNAYDIQVLDTRHERMRDLLVTTSDPTSGARVQVTLAWNGDTYAPLGRAAPGRGGSPYGAPAGASGSRYGTPGATAPRPGPVPTAAGPVVRPPPAGPGGRYGVPGAGGSPVVPISPAEAGVFLDFPLACGDPDCAFRYTAGAYTPGAISSVLDHSLKRNGSGYWQYGTLASGGADGIVLLFDGSAFSGEPKSGDATCIGGDIAKASIASILNSRGCGPGFVSYDEHPGYDYRAADGSEVRAAASGKVLNLAGERCYNSNIRGGCDVWGFVGIDHGNGFVTQYGHLSTITVLAGQTVSAGELIGLSGHTAPTVLGAHLHFEVLWKSGETYQVVDPYGWSPLTTSDPLYGSATLKPVRRWRPSK